jgi:hypothetical protein
MQIQLGAKQLVELGSHTCPAGKIRRSGYTRSDGTRVKWACVPDTGAPGKTPASKRLLPEIRPGDIGMWKKSMPDYRRHAELRKAVDRRGCRRVIGGLTLLRNKTADPATKATAKADWKWLRNQGFCKLKTK